MDSRKNWNATRPSGLHAKIVSWAIYSLSLYGSEDSQKS